MMQHNNRNAKKHENYNISKLAKIIGRKIDEKYFGN